MYIYIYMYIHGTTNRLPYCALEFTTEGSTWEQHLSMASLS